MSNTEGEKGSSNPGPDKRKQQLAETARWPSFPERKVSPPAMVQGGGKKVLGPDVYGGETRKYPLIGLDYQL